MRLGAKTAVETLRRHWFLYVDEGVELAIFMVAACVGTVLLFGVGSIGVREIGSAGVRRGLMGMAMGLTAVGIIHSPMGKRSGAHFNPAVTLTYLRLGKIGVWDAVGYVAGQFAGGIAGVGIAAALLGKALAQPSVEYAVTVPGVGGEWGAFGAEFVMAVVLMGTVLWSTNRKRLAGWTNWMVGGLIWVYVLVFGPVSGFSINPARTLGSAMFAGIWTGWWIYFVAPVAGMLVAAEIYGRAMGWERVICAKLHPAPSFLCPAETGEVGSAGDDAGVQSYMA
jgi:aquaporin Z